MVFTIQFEVKTLRTAQEVGLELLEAQKHKMDQLNEFFEMKVETLKHIDIIQQQHVKWHDKLIKKKLFHPGY